MTNAFAPACPILCMLQTPEQRVAAWAAEVHTLEETGAELDQLLQVTAVGMAITQGVCVCSHAP